jgi:hypothetical protein
MILIVCPLGEVRKQIAEVKPARVLSLLSPEQEAPRTPQHSPAPVPRSEHRSV